MYNVYKYIKLVLNSNNFSTSEILLFTIYYKTNGFSTIIIIINVLNKQVKTKFG